MVFGKLFAVIKRMLGLFVKIWTAIPRAAWNTLVQGGEVKKSADIIIDAKKTGLLFFYGDHFMFVDGKFTKDLKYITPKNLNRLFRVKKIYKNFATPERIVVVDNDNPEALDFENPPTEDEFERYVTKTISEKGQEIKTTVDMEKFRIKGGESLNSMAYDIYRHNILQFLSTPEKSELIYIIIAVAAIALLLGVMMGSIFGVIITAVL